MHPAVSLLTPDLLAGKVAIVTGAGRGFGSGIARGLARAGARLCILDIDARELGQTQDEILRETKIDQNNLLALVVDVTDAEAMHNTADLVVSRWGRLDIMINNAAIMPTVSFEETTPEIWNQIIGVNLTGVYNGVRAAWPHMVRQQSGHCIAIASGASVRALQNQAAYVATKHGLEGLTKALAVEGEPHHIAANTIGPGKRIKPTSVTREEAARLPAEEQAIWVDPIVLSPAFVWLAMQPPERFTGLRFDAGPLVDAIGAEGFDFSFAPEKATMFVDDFVARQNQRATWTRLS